MSGIRVVVTDLDTGEELEKRELHDDFMVLCEGNRYVAGVQAYGTGTQVVTVKRSREEGNSMSALEAKDRDGHDCPCPHPPGHPACACSSPEPRK